MNNTNGAFVPPASVQECDAPQWQNAKAELLALDQYQPNWDGEGADPVPVELIQATEELYERLRELGHPAPSTVYPTAGGTVMFEIHLDNDEVLSFNVRDPKRAEVVYRFLGKVPEFATVLLPLINNPFEYFPSLDKIGSTRKSIFVG